MLLAVAEHVVPLEFQPVPPAEPAYRALAALPPGALIEMPVFSRRAQFFRARYMLASTIHWMPLVNAYSDYIPPAFEARTRRARWLSEPRLVPTAQRIRRPLRDVPSRPVRRDEERAGGAARGVCAVSGGALCRRDDAAVRDCGISDGSRGNAFGSVLRSTFVVLRSTFCRSSVSTFVVRRATGGTAERRTRTRTANGNGNAERRTRTDNVRPVSVSVARR